jgi:hypothetical protein
MGRTFSARPGPSSSGPGPARPIRATTKAGPSRPGPSVLRPGPARSGPENFGNFPYNVCASFFTCLFFYRNICFSGYFYCIIYVFIVLSMFRGTFRKFSSLDRGKGNTRHRLRHTTRPTGNKSGRAGPGLNLGARPGPGPSGKLEFSGPARPSPRAARPILSSILDSGA